MLVGTNKPFRFLHPHTRSATHLRPGTEPREVTYPAVNRPIILVPAMVAWQMGITSCNSASKILCNPMRQRPVLFSHVYIFVFLCADHARDLAPRGRGGVPVEILTGTYGNESVGVCQRGENSNSVDIQGQLLLHRARWGRKEGQERTRWSFRTVRAPP